MIVVADTSPVHYLVLIEHVHLLPALFGEVIVPPKVIAELTSERAPQEVQTWLANKPEWLRVETPHDPFPQLSGRIDDGEREAIALAVELKADALLIDDRSGRREAEALQCRAVGTLGVLADAADRGLADLALAIERLRGTNFRIDEWLVKQILRRVQGT